MEDEQRVQLYTQDKSLDSMIIPSAEKQKPLKQALGIGNKGMAKAKNAWSYLLGRFHEVK